MNRLDVLNSPEGMAIRSRAKAAHEANEQEFKEKVDAIPGCVEAWEEVRGQLDELNRLWNSMKKWLSLSRQS